MQPSKRLRHYHFHQVANIILQFRSEYLAADISGPRVAKLLIVENLKILQQTKATVFTFFSL